MLKDTIISAFNYDGTLLKWLKKVEEALKDASASEFRVNKKGNATISFSIVFANGDTLESGDIVLQQGESVTGATIRQGHLILTLSNGNELDAGDLGAVTGFSINDSQHLIVTYQNGTTQDLGAIFNGTTIKVNTLTSDNPEISTLKPIVENMTGYAFEATSNPHLNINISYAGVCKNGNKVTFALIFDITKITESTELGTIGYLYMPLDVMAKILPVHNTWVAMLNQYFASDFSSGIDMPLLVIKPTERGLRFNIYSINRMELNVQYFSRFEMTFLLSDNLAE